jgi:hypothetical protein
MKTSMHMFLAALIVALGVATTHSSAAEDTKKKAMDEERKQAEQEEQRESSMTLDQKVRLHRQFNGVLMLGQEDNPDVVGTFVDNEGARRLVKVEHKDLLNLLKNYDGKKVALEGKLRNGEKYLVVMRVVEKAAGQKRIERRANGGI